MNNQKQYYNAKPSKISNIGADVAGARRMHFDTYETAEEKKQRKAHNKEVKQLKECFKLEILSDNPRADKLVSIGSRLFYLENGFHVDDGKEYLSAMRDKLDRADREAIKDFNSLVGKFNRFQRDIRGLESTQPYRQEFCIKRLAKRYRPKTKPSVYQTGATINWDSFAETKLIEKDFQFLSDNSKAVQFGNSVTDNERAYILNELGQFIQKWNKDSIFSKQSLTPLSWSFGARGKCNSVAYYDPDRVLISVNRNNIGSLVHEIGHYLDFTNGKPSLRISAETVRSYRNNLPKGLSSKEINYYCSRVEIFARAFEAYCIKVKADFSDFAQVTGKAFIPELTDELYDLIGVCFR